MIDPGPGTLARCWASRPKLDPSKLDALVLTHHHLDHANDATVIIEAMTNGGHDRRGLLAAPSEAYEAGCPLCAYAQVLPARREIFSPGSKHQVGDLTIRAAAQLQHSVETYALVFSDAAVTVGLVADTRYFDGLGDAVAGCDLLIVNVVLYDDAGRGILHMDVPSAERLIAEAKPRRAVITHFGMAMLEKKPWEIAEALAAAVGTQVTAAADGMLIDLSSQ
ncbi:MAG: MBL fold metallo-hydrolase [Armatimonadetes bacterium]|nr:MBL fold metallo-hydrolase [Armatimonadota bacterium]